MVLQALTAYYGILAGDPKSGIAPFGFSAANVSYALNLSKTGALLDVFPLLVEEQRGKKIIEVPRRMLVPEQVKRAHVSANFLCDNSAYVLGISNQDANKPEYSEQRHQDFKKLHTEILGNTNSAASQALLAFLNDHDPAKARDMPQVSPYLEGILAGGNLVFLYEKQYLHEIGEMRLAWEEYKQSASANAQLQQCLVTGEVLPISRLHLNLKGVKGGRPTGGSLVSFNDSAYESFNKSQGLNSPVSEKAMFAYITAANHLLSKESPNRKVEIGDTTVIYWAESNNRAYASVVESLFNPDILDLDTTNTDTPARDAQAERLMLEVAERIRTGRPIDASALPKGIKPETRFYVLGLAPNAARLSVRFFLRDPFIRFVERMMAHYQDMSIALEPGRKAFPISPLRIENETVSKKAKERSPSPLLGGSLMRSILTNTPYPAALYSSIITRIRSDIDDPQKGIQKINYVRSAVIKAYLLRKYRHQPNHPIQEVLSMALNEQSTNQAYLLGRLFAVLEGLQRSAAKPAKLNATIKDRYFTSACASPAFVFPVLLRLSQHHISKAGWGDRQIGGILEKLDVENQPFPSHLSLDQQGTFVLGYYHQRVDFFTSLEEAADQPQEN